MDGQHHCIMVPPERVIQNGLQIHVRQYFSLLHRCHCHHQNVDSFSGKRKLFTVSTHYCKQIKHHHFITKVGFVGAPPFRMRAQLNPRNTPPQYLAKCGH